MGCNDSKAREWMLRAQLEFNEHKHTAFTTLTYDDKSLPPTLNKRHLQLFLKRVRRKRQRSQAARIRFFACGEYGEKLGRPHYHAILFGASKEDAETIQKAWPHGHALTVDATPGAIAYVAGYTDKKRGDRRKAQEEKVDEETGEVYNYQPPFLQMSRRPGIGGDARDKYTGSWKSFAVHNGKKQPVPRFLHEAWKKQSTAEQREQLEQEKYELRKVIRQTMEQRKAAEQIAIKKQEMRRGQRKH